MEKELSVRRSNLSVGCTWPRPRREGRAWWRGCWPTGMRRFVRWGLNWRRGSCPSRVRSGLRWRQMVGLMHHFAPEVRSLRGSSGEPPEPPQGGGVGAGGTGRGNGRAGGVGVDQASLCWPGRDWLDPVLRWMESGTIAVGPALDSVWCWPARVGQRRRGPAGVDAVGAVARAPDALGLPDSGALGDDEDRDRLASFLKGDSTGLRVAAAEALLGYGEHLVIFEAAVGEPQVFEAAVRGWSCTVRTVRATTSSRGSRRSRPGQCGAAHGGGCALGQ